jgi:hypothetical protein
VTHPHPNGTPTKSFHGGKWLTSTLSNGKFVASANWKSTVSSIRHSGNDKQTRAKIENDTAQTRAIFDLPGRPERVITWFLKPG